MLTNCVGSFDEILEQTNFVEIEVGDKTCAEGHIGALCEACDIESSYWEESYAVAGILIYNKENKRFFFVNLKEILFVDNAPN